MKQVFSKVKSFYAMLRKDIYVGDRLKHNLLALTIISLFCAALGIG